MNENRTYQATLAQLVEQFIRNEKVARSIRAGSKIRIMKRIKSTESKKERSLVSNPILTYRKLCKINAADCIFGMGMKNDGSFEETFESLNQQESVKRLMKNLADL